jgi:hypothetical protein
MEKKLNVNSYVSLGLVVVILGAAVQLSTKLSRIESDLMTIRMEINTRMADRWTATMMGVYARESGDLNRDMKFRTPVVEDIQRRYPPGTIRER